MKAIETTYTCDRCGVVEQFVEGESPARQSGCLNDDGWRVVGISTVSGSPIGIEGTQYGSRLLCRLCYVAFIAFMEMPVTGMIFDSTIDSSVNPWPEDSQSSET